MSMKLEAKYRRSRSFASRAHFYGEEGVFIMKILVTDDESRLRRLLGDFLRRDGYEVSEAADGRQAVEIMRETAGISLVIMDVMMPNMNGLDACAEIRSFSQTPILMLTAKSQEEDELESFSCGADDFLTKPFSMPVLLARVRSLLRRGGETGEVMLTSSSGLVLDTLSHSVSVSGEQIELTPREFEFLHYMMKNKNIALSREQILNSVWNYDFYGDARTIDTHVKNLRMKLGSAGDCIRTVRSYGYKFEDAVNS